ncbi:hypothetical protein [Ferruginibacter sp.]|nr:hypothetical protein [Ferruginibacter sp.]
MKKIVSLALIMCCCFAATAQTDLKKKIVDSTCACLSEMPDLSSKSKDELQVAIGQCMMKKSMEDFMALAQERNIELTDMDGMQKLGMEIGIDLVKADCKAMNAIMMKMSESKITVTEKDAPIETPAVKGIIQNVEIKDFVYVTVLSGAKSVQLIWSDYVVNGNDYAKNILSLKNKTIEFFYANKDVYSIKS